MSEDTAEQLKVATILDQQRQHFRGCDTVPSIDWTTVSLEQLQLHPFYSIELFRKHMNTAYRQMNNIGSLLIPWLEVVAASNVGEEACCFPPTDTVKLILSGTTFIDEQHLLISNEDSHAVTFYDLERAIQHLLYCTPLTEQQRKWIAEHKEEMIRISPKLEGVTWPPSHEILRVQIDLVPEGYRADMLLPIAIEHVPGSTRGTPVFCIFICQCPSNPLYNGI